MSVPSPKTYTAHIVDCFSLSDRTKGYLPCVFEHWSMFYARRGTGAITSGADEIRLQTGELLLLPPAVCHAAKPAEDALLYVLTFDSTLPSPYPTYCRLTGLPQAAVKSMLALLLSGDVTGSARDQLLDALLLQLTTRPDYGFAPPPPMTLPVQVMHYLNAHYQEELSLADLTAVFHVSSSHLIHVCKPLLGRSPIQYLICRRVGAAQQLLRTTDRSATEIAGEVGVMNRNYFYRVFKRLVGLPPGEYRALMRASAVRRPGGNGAKR